MGSRKITESARSDIVGRNPPDGIGGAKAVAEQAPMRGTCDAALLPAAAAGLDPGIPPVPAAVPHSGAARRRTP
ncbi:hypothetical protein [Saccharopolyspora sp. SCSIO 74807]|uniref:hypothetical protein n=1 Tax=Saccharopolyspora sp. SCSIO 74807 TaxID=3118084 RepID=UPI0030D570D2